MSRAVAAGVWLSVILALPSAARAQDGAPEELDETPTAPADETAETPAAPADETAEAPPVRNGVQPGGEDTGAVQVTLHSAGTYGIGGYSAVGAQLHPVAQISLWNTDCATGTLDVGLLMGWQIEPQLFQFDVPDNLDNVAHRLNSWVTVGKSFHMGADRDATLGIHLFAGYTHVWSSARLVEPSLGIDDEVRDDYGRFNTGGMMIFDYRFSEYVGFNLQAAGPFPVATSYVNTLFHVGLGLTGYLR